MSVGFDSLSLTHDDESLPSLSVVYVVESGRYYTMIGVAFSQLFFRWEGIEYSASCL